MEEIGTVSTQLKEQSVVDVWIFQQVYYSWYSRYWHHWLLWFLFLYFGNVVVFPVSAIRRHTQDKNAFQLPLMTGNCDFSDGDEGYAPFWL